jgi:hypothetical protein
VKIYVAGASKEIDLVESYIAKLRDFGHVITEDWCAQIRKVGAANPTDIDREQCAEFAIKDLKGVIDCDVFWMLVPQNNSAGCWVEFGYALALKGRASKVWEIFVSGDHKRSIFCALSQVHLYDSHEEALRAISRFAI